MGRIIAYSYVKNTKKRMKLPLLATNISLFSKKDVTLKRVFVRGQTLISWQLSALFNW